MALFGLCLTQMPCKLRKKKIEKEAKVFYSYEELDRKEKATEKKAIGQLAEWKADEPKRLEQLKKLVSVQSPVTDEQVELVKNVCARCELKVPTHYDIAHDPNLDYDDPADQYLFDDEIEPHFIELQRLFEALESPKPAKKPKRLLIVHKLNEAPQFIWN